MERHKATMTNARLRVDAWSTSVGGTQAHKEVLPQSQNRAARIDRCSDDKIVATGCTQVYISRWPAFTSVTLHLSLLVLTTLHSLRTAVGGRHTCQLDTYVCVLLG